MLLEEGAARSGRSLAGFDIAPSINVFVNDDLVLARNVMRPGLALYIGGMGSREQNFYNQLAQRYGFEAAAREVQDLYLVGSLLITPMAITVEDRVAQVRVAAELAAA